jgi:hypothetical protein
MLLIKRNVNESLSRYIEFLKVLNSKKFFFLRCEPYDRAINIYKKDFSQ